MFLKPNDILELINLLRSGCQTPINVTFNNIENIEEFSGKIANQIEADSTTLLNRHLPIDLRENSFPLNSVASTAFHHCSVTLWRSVEGYELFLPRAFALSLWEILVESASQFGYEIK